MSGRASRSVLVVPLLFLAAAVVFGCDGRPAATPTTSNTSEPPVRLELTGTETIESFQKYIGRTVTVCGYWGDELGQRNLIGAKKKNGDIVGERGELVGGHVFLEHMPGWFRIPRGAYLEVTGELLFYERKPSPPAPPGAATTQPSPTGYRLDPGEASFRFPRHE